jgi:AAA15 family ATPase/GTPase
MLRYFRFSNYKSFRDEALLDLRAKNITEHKQQLTKISSDKSIKIISIFGLNSAGKSNIYSAFKHMSMYVINSFSFEDNNSKKGFKTPNFIFDTKYLEVPTKFEVSFVGNFRGKKRVIKYSFSIKRNIVEQETLWVRAISNKKYTLIYDRFGLMVKSDNKDFLRHMNNLNQALKENVLVASLGAKLNIELLLNLRDWFLNNNVINFGNEMESLVRETNLPDCLVDGHNNPVKEKLIKYIRCFDHNIVDFDVKELPSDEDNSRTFYVDVVYKNSKGEIVKLPLAELSAGTRKMFSLFQYLVDTLENGGVLFIDEINAKIHPYLHKFIINIFENDNHSNAQLIFTTHETWLLPERLIRRDGFYFVEKHNFTSTLISLFDCKDEKGNRIRKDANFLEYYLKNKSGNDISTEEIF